MNKKEDILLDATLCHELRYPTFRAELDNGHEVVAFPSPSESEATMWKPGMRVRVALSPFSMGEARIRSFLGYHGEIP